MARRIPTPFIAPDAAVGASIAGIEYDAGALHELIIQGNEARWQLTKLVDRPTLFTPPGDPTIIDAPQSFGSIPQTYDPVTDMLYVLQQRHRVVGSNRFVVSRIEVLVIDPRSKQVVNRKDLFVRDSTTVLSTFYPDPVRIISDGVELHCRFTTGGTDNIIVLDINTLNEVANYPALANTYTGMYMPVGPNRYVTWTGNTNTPTATLYQRELNGTFTLLNTAPAIELATGFGSPGTFGATDPVNGLCWIVTRSAYDDGVTTGQNSRIAARWDTVLNTVTYIAKQTPAYPPGTNSYVTRDPEVVNGRFTFNTKRNKGSDQAHGITIVSTDGNTVTRYGESQDQANGTFSDRPGPIRITYDGTKGYATCFWDNNALFVWDITQPSHVKYDQYLYTAGTAGVGQIDGGGNTGQGTYSSPRSTLINWTGAYTGAVGVPTNNRVVSAPAYNRTPPTPFDTITPPAAGQGTISGNYEFDYPGANALVPVRWHAIPHDGLTRKVISFLVSTDGPTNSYYNWLVAGQIDAALYTPGGRCFGRLCRGESVMYQSGYPRNEQENGISQYGFVIPETMPAGTYYVGVLPYYNEQYNGRTVFSDYDFDGWTFDPSTTNPGVNPTIKYRIRVQTRPSESQGT